ncbi:MAG: M23 family metallopeptidase [Alphaproteobacteria bacterium]|nr:MAG: M23 family metallopeptidase [Alphaproteobacteria bacterium]
MRKVVSIVAALLVSASFPFVAIAETAANDPVINIASGGNTLAVCGASTGSVSNLFEGGFEQGGLIRGQVLPGTNVLLDSKPVPTDDQGRFVFGFDRDFAAKTNIKLVRADCEFNMDFTVAQRKYDISYVEGVDQKYVEPPAEVLARIRAEGAQKRAARSQNSSSDGFFAEFKWPLTGRISGVYGSQRYYNGTPKTPHYGVDVAAPSGTTFYAPAPGVVTLANEDMYYEGGLIFLDHGMGVISAFLHLSGVDVKVGDVVQTGDPLGRVGAKGRANGPHLDWRMYWQDQHIDPELLVGPMPDGVAQ